ncbi:MAG: PepSY domain-containing protein [Methylococcaceae bacterium]
MFLVIINATDLQAFDVLLITRVKKIILYILCWMVLLYSAQASARISLDDAVRQLVQQGQKRVLGAQTEIVDGREVYVIKVLTPDGRVIQYLVDTETGQVIN